MSSVVSIILSILTVCASNVGASSPASFWVGPRPILRSIEQGEADRPDFAVELNATSFDPVLKETPAAYAVVEFFAHWCPACRNYKAQYEKVAKLFNGADAVHPGIVLMTRVDCALKINTNLCEKFCVGHYPMLFWGPTSKFVSGSWDQKQDKSEIRPIDNGRTAENLLKWINKQVNGCYGLDDKRYDVEEATLEAFGIILDDKVLVEIDI